LRTITGWLLEEVSLTGAAYATIDQVADDENVGDTRGSRNALTEIGLKCSAGIDKEFYVLHGGIGILKVG
jgi:hypothetical protein